MAELKKNTKTAHDSDGTCPAESGFDETISVLFLPENVAGEPSGLSKALLKLGVHSEVWSRKPHKFGYPSDTILSDEDSPPVRRFLDLLFASRYLFQNWTIIHFTFGSTLFDPGNREPETFGPKNILSWAVRRILEVLSVIELAILRLRRIPVFVHFQGDDARQLSPLEPASHPEHIAGQVEFRLMYGSRSNLYRARRIRRFASMGAVCVAVNPDLMNYLPPNALFLPYAGVNPNRISPTYPRKQAGVLRLAHAPSNRDVKGTELILKAVEELQKEGFLLSLDLIEGVPNEEALERIASCDVLVDQLYVGWYGLVAVEAMSLGKVCVAYINTSDLKNVPKSLSRKLPIVRSSADQFAATLRYLANLSSDELVALGKKGRQFAQEFHNPDMIALRLLDRYTKVLEN